MSIVDSSQRRQGLGAVIDGATAGYLSEPPSNVGDGLVRFRK